MDGYIKKNAKNSIPQALRKRKCSNESPSAKGTCEGWLLLFFYEWQLFKVLVKVALEKAVYGIE